jgi:hypothetical protein
MKPSDELASIDEMDIGESMMNSVWNELPTASSIVDIISEKDIESDALAKITVGEPSAARSEKVMVSLADASAVNTETAESEKTITSEPDSDTDMLSDVKSENEMLSDAFPEMLPEEPSTAKSEKLIVSLTDKIKLTISDERSVIEIESAADSV